MKNKEIGVLSVALLVLLTAAPSAMGQEPGESIDSLLVRVAPDVRDNLYSQNAKARGAAQTQSATIPESTSEPVTTRGSDVEDLSIWLPEAASSSEMEIGGENVRVFDHENGTTTIPLAKDDGSAQILTIIDDSGAPEMFSYPIDTPDDASITIDSAGAVHITVEDKMIGGVVAPWAVDSDGKPVPTHYEIDGMSLVQVVDHVGEGFSYPIVADPWLGQDLYTQPYISYVSQGYKVNVSPRPWGTSWTGIETWFAHRDEIKTKLGSNSWRWNNSIQEQLYCHIAGLPASLPEYNLESWRPTINWAQSLSQYKCNPYDGKWS